MNTITNLYKHQELAFEKLHKLKVGALYMEQGTGKTRTALELIKHRINLGKIEKVIWLCPCSVKEDLRRDIIKHVGELPKYIIICGIQTLSSSINANIKLLDIAEKYKTYLIVDESNLVKNHLAKRTSNIIRIANKCTYKSILNGTPITKNEADLFSQWYILDYRILGYKSFWSFEANHIEYDEKGRIRRCLNIDYLTKKISPYTYQVLKKECLDLPDKTYDTKYYELSNEQYEHYDKIADELMFSLDEFKPETIYRLFTGLQNIICGMRVTVIKDKKNTDRIISTPFFDNPHENPRIELLLNILEQITEKVIIFAKYTSEIDDIYDTLIKKYGEESAVRYYGKLNLKKRQNNFDKFSADARFFVANKVCAGYGLNMQFCSYIIYYSNDWDYGTRSQSEDRVHRIGQNKNVNIIKFAIKPFYAIIIL